MIGVGLEPTTFKFTLFPKNQIEAAKELYKMN